ncbi:threonine aldolase family protein [Dysgonomonas sp. GY617]|uniref:threonine aldolase family protein n=1 Tax=Dysgonomonas sp. GY617 TaxID=2780420 RepID=UPI0018848AF2|nr:aminotransferase class I/II-fold pyridoxal phosphate-dependent enzyme [Dysgonomonas sp. GY617]MBF0577973.1 aminotransferase class V-fold PLP-dependent enzyme [Dysgonomonas sp. GY617]
MIIHSFTNDYSEGCHPSILQALTESNLIQQSGYGDDAYTLSAIQSIKNKIGDDNAEVHLISGGTLTNLLVLASILKPFESVIAAQTGHISTHETGAIEATGHKIEEVITSDGKLTPELIKPVLNKFPEYHTVKPRVVYISNSTEIGTIYNKKELTNLSEFCKENNLILFMDGARLPSALTAASNDLTLVDVARLTDVFYIGGTKSGALLGEAVVITNDTLKKDFKYHQKQRGAMMAKGRVIGIQFDQLLKDDLIFKLAAHANILATKIKDTVKELGYSFLTESDSNQIFPILPNKVIDKLILKYGFYVWEPVDADNSAVRLITSWATPEDKVDLFIHDLKEISKIW